MKKLQDLISQPAAQPSQGSYEQLEMPFNQSQSTDGSTQHEQPIDPQQPEVHTVDDIPEYFIYDSEIVGYPDENYQAMIYQYSITGVLPLIGQASVLDVGCGRGDLNAVIKQFNDEIQYNGVEFNQLLVNAGLRRYPTMSDSNIEIGDFLQVDFDNTYDYIFNIGSLNANYGLYQDSNWAYFNKVLDKSLAACNVACVFTLLQQTDSNDDFVTYPIPNMTDMLLQRQLKFTIDYVAFSPEVYKLVIYK